MSNDTPNTPFSTLDLSNFLSSMNATRTTATKTSVPTHHIELNLADLCSIENFRPLVPTAFVAPFLSSFAFRKLANTLKTSHSTLAVTAHVSLSVHAKTYCVHVSSPNHVNAPRTSDHTLLTSLTAPNKIANVSTTRHPRHQQHALLTHIDVASLLSCFASYLPSDLNDVRTHTARSFITDTVNASHTHYSFVSLAHITASIFAKLHESNATYAPVFNTILSAFNMSDDPRMIDCTFDAYPTTVHNNLRSLITPSNDNPDTITIKHN